MVSLALHHPMHCPHIFCLLYEQGSIELSYDTGARSCSLFLDFFGSSNHGLSLGREGGKAASLLGFRVEARKRSMAVVPCWRIKCRKAWWLYCTREASLYSGEEGEQPPPRAGAQGVESPVPNLPLYPNGLVALLYTWRGAKAQQAKRKAPITIF
jgi:hypothetical protein